MISAQFISVTFSSGDGIDMQNMNQGWDPEAEIRGSEASPYDYELHLSKWNRKQIDHEGNWILSLRILRPYCMGLYCYLLYLVIV